MKIKSNYEINAEIINDISNILSDYDIVISKRFKSFNISKK